MNHWLIYKFSSIYCYWESVLKFIKLTEKKQILSLILTKYLSVIIPDSISFYSKLSMMISKLRSFISTYIIIRTILTKEYHTYLVIVLLLERMFKFLSFLFHRLGTFLIFICFPYLNLKHFFLLALSFSVD